MFSGGLHGITATGVIGAPMADSSAAKGEKHLSGWADLLLEKK
ncbi:MAG: hypothetical protein ACOX3A_08945 [bacterium]